MTTLDFFSTGKKNTTTTATYLCYSKLNKKVQRYPPQSWNEEPKGGDPFDFSHNIKF